MKKQLIYIATIATVLLQACKKEREVNPVSNIIHKEVNEVMDIEHPVLLDIDANFETDFSFFVVEEEEGDLQSTYLTAYPEIGTGNKIVVKTNAALDDWGFLAKAFNKDNEIGTNMPQGYKWNDNLTTAILLASDNQNNNGDIYGPWNNKQNAYLGIQLEKNGKTYYGWVRLSHVAGKQQIIVNEYAYSTIPDKPIKAGQL